MILAKHVISVLFLLLQSAFGCDCFVRAAWTETAALKLYPESIHVSPNNPGHLLIYQGNADGSLLDVPDHSSLVIEVQALLKDESTFLFTETSIFTKSASS